MESTGRFEKIFFKMLKEMNTAGADGSFGDGPSRHTVYGPNAAAQNIDSGDTYAPGDARVPKVLGKGKVQTRKGPTGGKKKKKKGVNYATGEENEEGKAKDPVGMDTYWEDGDLKVTITEVLKYLDDIDEPVEDVSTDNLKSMLIAADRDDKRVQAADLKYPVIIVVGMNGKYKSILDGNHRVDKAIRNDIPTVKVRHLHLQVAPKKYQELLDYEIKK